MTSTLALGPYARASALSNKARELLFRGHNERSDDKQREALAAARAVGTEDCLVTAYLAVAVAQRASEWLAWSLEQENAAPDRLSVADRLRELAHLVAGAAAVAQRRRAAGTHQPAEQAWYMADHAAALREAALREANGFSEISALESAKHAASIGSETTVSAACAALCILGVAATWSLFSASELSGRLGVICDLVDEAVALCGLHRMEGTFNADAWVLERRLRDGATFWRQQSSTAAHAERLAAALVQLCLHSTMTADEQALADKKVKEGVAKAAAAYTAATAPELRRNCALASCGAKEAHVRHFKRCGACNTVVYCSKTCQLADWPAHKKACKAARKAATEAQ